MAFAPSLKILHSAIIRSANDMGLRGIVGEPGTFARLYSDWHL